MDRTYMLSTLDNPFDPFDDFTSWYMFDCEKGHNTSSRLARIANLNDEMTQKEIDEAREDLKKKYLEILYSNPCGFKLTAGMTTNYRQLKTIYHQRKTHRLPEWREFCAWIETLPMFRELCLGGENNE